MIVSKGSPESSPLAQSQSLIPLEWTVFEDGQMALWWRRARDKITVFRRVRITILRSQLSLDLHLLSLSPITMNLTWGFASKIKSKGRLAPLSNSSQSRYLNLRAHHHSLSCGAQDFCHALLTCFHQLSTLKGKHSLSKVLIRFARRIVVWSDIFSATTPTNLTLPRPLDSETYN